MWVEGLWILELGIGQGESCECEGLEAGLWDSYLWSIAIGVSRLLSGWGQHMHTHI